MSEDFFDRYQLGRKLGRGAFAQVRVATKVSPLRPEKDAHEKREMAVKILDMRDKDGPNGRSPQVQKAAHKEATVWQALGSHPNCVRLHHLFFDSCFCWMVMEKCTSGLLQVLESMPELNELSLGNIAAQMLLGIAHCHSMQVVHRDIKPDNYMVGGEGGQVVKLCDFGLSAMMPKQGKLQGVFGTAPFMCPEMLKGSGYDEKADVWAYAVIMYVLLFGTFPYMPPQPSAKAMKEAIVMAAVPPSFAPVEFTKATAANNTMRSDSAISFVKALLQRRPSDRPSAEEALGSPWVSSPMSDLHGLGIQLPSLRPMLYNAKKVGAFEDRNPDKVESTDEFLNSLQMEKHGTPLPGSRQGRLQQGVDRQKLAVKPKPASDNGSSTSTTVSDGSSRSCGMLDSNKPSSGCGTPVRVGLSM